MHLQKAISGNTKNNMANKNEQHIIKGMQRDLSVSKFNPEFAFECMNIRLTARDNNTLLSVTNEKGNKEISLDVPIEGTVIGYNVLNNYIVLFTTGDFDRIYRIQRTNNIFNNILLFSGNLNFKIANPIESLSVFEKDDVQKVYWVDGINPVRVINIMSTSYTESSYAFNLLPYIGLSETIKYSTLLNSVGLFPAGVVQYAFSYYNPYMQETSIFNTSPLLYSAFDDRGGNPEETTPSTFRISLSGLDTSFKYLRIYSIFRTSIDATPTVKVVADLSTSGGKIDFVDNNTAGYTIDPSTLLYIGGDDVTARTLTQKDNTLFLGDIKLNKTLVPTSVVDKLRGTDVSFINKRVQMNRLTGYYSYSTQLRENSQTITTFKYGETYRFGIQLQNKTGQWSEPIFTRDKEVDKYPNINAVIIPGVPSSIEIVKGGLTVSPTIASELLNDLGYVRARGVVVYPDASSRTILCQGLISPTVSNNKDKENNSPYVQSSWFARPFLAIEIPDSYEKYSSSGSYAEFRHGIPLPQNNTRSGEVQSDTIVGGSPDARFNVDSSIVTFHSPEIEFGDLRLSSVNLKFRIAGAVNMSSLLSDMSLTTTTVSDDITAQGFYNKTASHEVAPGLTGVGGARMLISSVNWMEKAQVNKDSKTTTQMGFLISPWQRSGSLINYGVPEAGKTRPSVLDKHKMSNLRFCDNTIYLSKSNFWKAPSPNITTFDSNEVTSVTVDNKVYYGNIDKIIPAAPKTESYVLGYAIGVVSRAPYDTESLYKGNINNTETAFPDADPAFKYFNDPVHIKYKSTPHAVISLGGILPDNGNNINQQPVIKGTSDIEGLWVGEVYTDIDESTRFGGTSEAALEANKWLIAGPSVPIDANGFNIEYLEGDTYFQRYDCLKTYPFTLEDTNSVTEIVSAYCETRLNIDGRYDRNRGNKNNLVSMPSNFNLYNPVYTQKNTFFPQRYINRSLFNINSFPNTIIWSKEKFSGELVDTWSSINASSSLELDGDKGEVISLNTFNNEVYCFQRKGFSNILFNSRIQIPASDGVPIEITNGMKVGGKRYISNSTGCSNKWSIVESPSGLYFIDNETNSLYLYNGQLDSLSDKLGFRQWIGENNSHSDWNPIDYDNFRSFYDKNNNDVYFVNDKNCLCYSELLGQFTSFMSYEELPAMFNISSDFYAIKNGKLWEQFAGDYNSFFGVKQPYYIDIVSNANSSYDKIFNNVEFRSDTWDGNTLLPNKTFDTLDVYNEYQHGKVTLSNILDKPSSLKRKFRIWRALIPRANTPINGITSNNRDRIRNTWAHVKLSSKGDNSYRTEFHDMVINYFL